ncbi:MAG: polysaccharide deacetylase family protein [Pseudomonadota bacterium]
MSLLTREKLAWPNGARLALSIVVNVEEGSELSVARGDPGMEPVDELGVFVKSPIRNFGNESNYLYGLKAGAPRIVDLLVKYNVAATWTVAAQSLEVAPDLAEVIGKLGHEPAAHGARWVHQFKMDETEERDFIRGAADRIEQACGRRPVGWLSRYLHTASTRRLLAEAGYRYHMDDYSGDVPFFAPDQPDMVVVPYQLDTNDMKMWVNPAYTPEMWLDYAKHSFDTLYQEGDETPRMMSLGLHLRIIGRPGRIWALEAFLQHATARCEVWITTREAIASHLRDVTPAAL